MWLARLTEKGLLRPSFVPPAEIRAPRDYTRARTHLTQDRTRCRLRPGKLPGGALIKVSAVASKLTTVSAQDMIRALIGGERDPRALAALARGRMRSRHDALAGALTGMSGDHHAELAGMLPGQISFPGTRITRLTTATGDQTGEIPAAWGIGADGAAGPAGTGPDPVVLPAVMRLDEIPGISAELACPVIAETGPGMSRFPTAGHLVSWAGLSPRAIQSGPRTRHARGQGSTYLRGYLGQAAIGAAGTATFPGERYHRIARRRGGARAQVAVARSILVIIWHLLADREARFTDLGPDYYQNRTGKDKKARSHIRQLQALGYTVTVAQAAA